MSRPVVVMVAQHAYPHDRLVRFRKMATTLSAEADVVITCPGAEGLPEAETRPEGQVIRRGEPSRARPVPWSLSWAEHIRHLARRTAASCGIVGDLRLALPAIIGLRAARVPVIVDLGENFPAATRVWARQDPLLRRLWRSGPQVAWLERLVCHLADRVQVVIEERRDQMLRDYRLPTERILVVSNTPDAILEDHCVEAALVRRRERKGGPLRVLYAGVLTRDRGLDEAVSALRDINRDGRTPMVLDVVGDGTHRAALEENAADLVASGLCVFHGWLSGTRLTAAMLEADVGLIPHHVSPFTNSTVPNKLFDYMNCGLPVVATRMAPVARILHETHAGVVVSGTGELRAALQAMRSARLRFECAAAGRRAVKGSYNWGVDGARFASAVLALARRRSRRSPLG